MIDKRSIPRKNPEDRYTMQIPGRISHKEKEKLKKKLAESGMKSYGRLISQELRLDDLH